MTVPDQFRFLEDLSLDPETKRALLQDVLDERKSAREAAQKTKDMEDTRAFEEKRQLREAEERKNDTAATRALEQKRFWHSTPLVVTLVGTITIIANGLVTYLQSDRNAAEAVTMKNLEAKFKESEERLKQQFLRESSEADAKRHATKDEREFAFKIIERELAKAGDSTSRATVLLFLVKAGILNSLNRAELEAMAKADLENAEDPSRIKIPPTLGRPSQPVAGCGPSIGSASGPITKLDGPAATDLAARIIVAMERKGYRVDRKTGEINIVYIEGANSDGTANGNEPDKWNDLRVVIRFEGGSPRIVGSWVATTEPGLFYTMNPLPHSRGAARIEFGQYAAWVVGAHGPNLPQGHEALIQVEPITVCRDVNKDSLRAGDPVDIGVFGLNQHGGYGSPNVDKEGAGSLIGQSRAGHLEFMSVLKSDPRYLANRSFRFTTTIIGALELDADR